MKKHLRFIAKHLPDGTNLAKKTEAVAVAAADGDVDADADAADVDAEFYTIQLDAMGQTLPKACNDWLELMVLHFDAVQHLADYVKLVQSREVNINIVCQGSPDRYMLPWRTLLNNDRYFPKNSSCSVADIISFLQPVATSTTIVETSLDPAADPTANPASVTESFLDPAGNSTTSTSNRQMISAETFVQRLKEIGTIPKVVESEDGERWNLKKFTEAIEPIIEKMRRRELANCTSAGWEEYSNTILQRLVSLRDGWTLNNAATTVEDIEKIVRMVDAMRDNAMIYWALRDDTPLSTGVGFAGNFHAEAILAAYWRLQDHKGSVSRPFPCPA